MITSLKKNIKSLSGVTPLIVSNSTSKLVLAVGSLILAKLYGPQSFGIYAALLSISYILTVVASFNLDSMIMLIDGAKETRSFLIGIFLTSTTCSIVIFLFLTITKQLNYLSIEGDYFFLLILCLGSLFTVWNNAQISLLTKFRQYKKVAVAILIMAIATLIPQFALYYNGSQNYGLLNGWVIGLICTTLYCLAVSKVNLRFYNISSFRANTKKFISIIKYAYPASIIDVIASNTFVILTLSYFSAAEVGVYAIAARLLSLPLTVLSASFSKFYTQKALALYKNFPKELLEITQSIIIINLLLITIFLAVVNTIGVYFLDLLLERNEWPNLNYYISILSIWILLRCMVNPISSIITVIKKNHWSLLFNIYIFLIILLAVYIGVHFQNYRYCLTIYSMLSGLAYAVLLGLIINHLLKNAKR